MQPQEVLANTRLINEGETGETRKEGGSSSIRFDSIRWQSQYERNELSGSHLYVSESGNFEIYVGKTYYGRFGAGIAFGELALLYDMKRLCSIDGIREAFINLSPNRADQLIAR